MYLELENLTKHYGDVRAVDHVSLGVEKGEFVIFLGPSGSGKSTILRMIAGFVIPTSGHIRINGRSIDKTPTHKRDLGMVFQDYSLFPHLNVFQNIAFGLRMRKLAKNEIRRRVQKAMETVQLQGLDMRMTGQLSGGQRQRVALARAIVIEPLVLLLDEPLGALDRKLREEMQVELRSIHDRLGITTIFVTHDQDEALALADRIAIMRDGRIEQLGTPTEVYEHPVNSFVAQFLGKANLLTPVITDVDHTGVWARLADGYSLSLPVAGLKDAKTGDRLRVLVRPERIECNFCDRAVPPGQLACEVERVIYMGAGVYLILKGPGGVSLMASVPAQAMGNCRLPEVGQKIGVTWPQEANIVLEKVSK